MEHHQQHKVSAEKKNMQGFAKRICSPTLGIEV